MDDAVTSKSRFVSHVNESKEAVFAITSVELTLCMRTVAEVVSVCPLTLADVTPESAALTVAK